MNNNNDILFSKIKIGNTIVDNRIVINAMEGNDADLNGNPSLKTYRRYRELFKANPGVIILEAISITEEHVCRKNQLTILPKNEKALEKFVCEMKKINKNPLLFFQLNHAGELSNPNFSKRVCVKKIPGFEGTLLYEEDIKKIIKQYVLSAKIAYNCGADGIDIKFGHGYLGSQILRPYNDRKFSYGGPWENRRRFAFDILEEILKEIKDSNFIIGSKISIWEGLPGGQGCAEPDSSVIDFRESFDLIKGLEERGASYIIESAGNAFTLSLQQPDKNHIFSGYLHHGFQKQIKDIVKSDTVVIGSAYSVFGRSEKNKVESISYWGNKNIKNNVVDMIAIGRQSLADPLFPSKLRENKIEEINWCLTCNRCRQLLRNQKNVGCPVYNKEYR